MFVSPQESPGDLNLPGGQKEGGSPGLMIDYFKIENFSSVIEAIDVTFQRGYACGEVFNSKKIHFSGKHKAYRWKTIHLSGYTCLTTDPTTHSYSSGNGVLLCQIIVGSASRWVKLILATL